MVNEHLRRAVSALETGAAEVRGASHRSAHHVRDRLQRTVEEVLQHLEAEQQLGEPDPEDMMSNLDRQSKDIADDLRRVERLMKERLGQD